MASAAQGISAGPSPPAWWWEFLKEELAPYAGRVELVSRMVLAATIVMIIGMTFRIPYVFQGAIYALIISRESSRATLRSAGSILLLTAVGAVYLVLSARFVMSVPSLHLFWIMGSFFLAFLALTALSDFGASSTFAIMIALGVPFWDRPLSAETNVEDVLWVCWASAIGILVTVAVELSAQVKPGDDIVTGVAERLAAVHALLVCHAAGRSVDRATESRITRLAVVGTSMFRRILRRAAYMPHYAERMGALVALTGTLVDLAANRTLVAFQLSDDDRKSLRRLAENVARVRADLLAGRTPPAGQGPAARWNALPATPLLPEMERTVALMDEVLMGSRSLTAFALRPSSGDPEPTFFVRDAFTNAEHIEFAVKGCLTASLCYIIYKSLDWPAISTAVTTCFLTALSTIGASRQKQVLRIGGAVLGGLVLGMGAQIFILPHLDSIAGFTVLFILVTAVASWFMTSSARLSYFGVQIAVAFYLIHLNSFAMESSLSVARDRVVGISLGLVMMWLVFDRLWSAPALVEMKKTFTSALRMLAQFAREPLSGDTKVAIERNHSLRQAINKSFDGARASADALLFEFGSSRPQYLAWRDAIRTWQPQLRAFFVTRIALWKYRLQLPGFELPEAIRASQRDFDERAAAVLDGMAGRLEGGADRPGAELEDSFERLEEMVRTYHRGRTPEAREPQLHTFLHLCRRLKDLATSLDRQILGNVTAPTPATDKRP